MSFICENCGKGTVSGHTQRHGRGVAGKRWKNRAPKTSREFKPNLQNVSIMEAGKKMAVKVCAKCLKRFQKEGRLYKAPTVATTTAK